MEPLLKDLSDAGIKFVLFEGLQMTQHPCGTLADNTDVAITCMTSNIPPADNLVWAILQEGRHPIHNMNDSKIKRHKTGNMLIVTANKILHHKVVECCLSENPEMRDAVTMHVKSKCEQDTLFIFHIFIC